ncbi:MAG: type II toxin-antitoxin system VapC family toxin [Fimbriimonas sp.]|nr:type II toxin-antitoxin system VapC family toxin [Fimbriimonas sp.]
MAKFAQGLLDTSVLIDLESIDPDLLPNEASVSAISMAELSAGPHATSDVAERARRQARLQFIEASLSPIPFDADCARAFGLVFAAVSAAGRKPRGARAVDLMIAATSVSLGIPLFTRNAVHFIGLEGLTEIVSVP